MGATPEGCRRWVPWECRVGVGEPTGAGLCSTPPHTGHTLPFLQLVLSTPPQVVVREQLSQGGWRGQRLGPGVGRARCRQGPGPQHPSSQGLSSGSLRRPLRAGVPRSGLCGQGTHLGLGWGLDLLLLRAPLPAPPHPCGEGRVGQRSSSTPGLA